MITIKQAMLITGNQNLRRLCLQGRVQGAYKIGYQWVIPTPVIILPPKPRKNKKK